MKILIDINHPAHVHYFRNFIKIMEGKGHEFIVTNRDSKMINHLLDHYEIPHIVRTARSSKKGSLGAAMNLLSILKTIASVSFKHKPDLYLGFANAPSAIIAKLRRKPCILLDDTDHNVLNHKLYLPGASVVLTPFYFNRKLGKKQIYFNAFVEQLYLHSKIYEINHDNIMRNNLKEGEYALVRYIAYDAHHDAKTIPMETEQKIDFLNIISDKLKPVLSVEEKAKVAFPAHFTSQIIPETMHDIEAGAKFILTEGGTMATECFLLGIPYIIINPLRSGASDYQTSQYPDVAIQSTNSDEIRDAIIKFSSTDHNAEEHRKKIESTTFNPTAFLVWFVENYPKSEMEIRNNPNIQYNFK